MLLQLSPNKSSFHLYFIYIEQLVRSLEHNFRTLHIHDYMSIYRVLNPESEKGHRVTGELTDEELIARVSPPPGWWRESIE